MKYYGLKNSSSNITSLMDECSNTHYVTAHTAVSAVQIAIGGFFNGLVIFLLSTNRHLLRIPSNVILLSLSIWDFFACLVVVPCNIHVMYTYDRKSVQHFALFALLCFSILGSMFGAVTITVDRYLACVHPFTYNTLVTAPRICYVFVLNCTISFILAIAYFLTEYYKYGCLRCFLSALNVICCLTIFTLYGAIFRAARQQIRKIYANCQKKRFCQREMCKKSLKSARNSASVVLFFFASYTPLFVTFLMAESKSLGVCADDLKNWSHSTAFWNSCVNPLLYCFFSEKLRSLIAATFRRFSDNFCR